MVGGSGCPPSSLRQVCVSCSAEVGRKLFRWFVFDRYWLLEYVLEIVTFVGLDYGFLGRVVCEISIGVLPPFRVGLLLFKLSFFLSLVSLLRHSYFSVSQCCEGFMCDSEVVT